MLEAHPRFRLGEEHFEAHVWDSMRKEGDFLNVGVWEGEYAELIRLLAPFHDVDIENSLIRSGKRSDNAISVATAMIMAAVDLARDNALPEGKESLKARISARAAEEYAFKMATGSGKTWVMAMTIVWSHFHRKTVPGSGLSTNFLIIAPNVIVYQRLERDLAANRIFYQTGAPCTASHVLSGIASTDPEACLGWERPNSLISSRKFPVHHQD